VNQPVEIISASAVAARVQELAAAIDIKLPPGPITVVGVLRGAFVFMADLVRAIPRPITCDFLSVRSYGDATVSTGVVQITSDLANPIEHRHVLLVEDIVDTGWTLDHVVGELRKKKPASLKLAALLHKPSRTRVQVPIDYLGFTIPDRFVVGYGLDFDGRYRNLPHVAVLDA
jgi:hypoxanthine phosphoribosyltransferase